MCLYFFHSITLSSTFIKPKWVRIVIHTAIDSCNAMNGCVRNTYEYVLYLLRFIHSHATHTQTFTILLKQKIEIKDLRLNIFFRYIEWWWWELKENVILHFYYSMHVLLKSQSLPILIIFLECFFVLFRIFTIQKPE